MQQRILNLIGERKDELFSLLSDLVKINSESFGSYGNEEEIAKYIDVLCKDLGLESDLYSPPFFGRVQGPSRLSSRTFA